MDPIAVFRTIWQHRIVAVPIVVLTALAAIYVYQFAPRSYQSSSTYAMINPDIPTQLDVLKDPQLGNLNPKNPYLRSSDPSLIVQVMLTKMNDSATADLLASQDLGDEYTVSRGVGGINGFLVDITGEGETPEKSIATTQALGNLLQKYLYDAQKVNGADDAYLFSSIVVATPDKATEQFSSRLRALIVVFLGGVVMMFGAVSVARSMAVTKERRQLLSGEPEGRAKRRQGPTVNRFREEQTGPSGPTVLAPHFDGEHSQDEPQDLKATQGRGLAGLKR
jgi:hypothetical protein